MQIQSIYSPNFVQKNSLATKANANSVAQNNPQYSIGTLDALAFKGNYYHYKPTADDKRSMILLDVIHEGRFDDYEKRDIMFTLRQMETDGKKSQFLAEILSCRNNEDETLTADEVESAINILSGYDLDTQKAISSVYTWKNPLDTSTRGYDLIGELTDYGDVDLAMEQIGNMDQILKAQKVPANKRGQILGNALMFMRDDMRKYAPIMSDLLKALADPKKGNNFLYWEIFSDGHSIEEIKEHIKTA